MLLGLHASIRNGFSAALQETARFGCRTVQIFSRRPGDPAQPVSGKERAALDQFREAHRISQLLVHAVFQPNPASTQPKVWQRSRESLLDELRCAEALGADYFVVHAGSYSPESDRLQGIRRCAEAMRWLLDQVPGPIKLLIENVGGGARRIGGTFEELRSLMDAIEHENRTGVCFDTAHAFAAGYAIQTAAGLEDCLADFDRKLGLDRLLAFHLNDSGAPLGSHNDIHAHIGRGFIGPASLKKFAADPRFSETAGIFETPHFPLGSDEKNLAALRA